ncbi:hypothetical protein EUX98_g1445 [Antrodiella citrinella]|uniref:Autophagy-related protein n=1 Tax=Antrodiella citrinella TaxID=2447956 RepID=A0A4S4N2Z1_9APHY|nr:hypothetical protein EUX98_g1445 [Antrodiella citrinella]
MGEHVEVHDEKRYKRRLRGWLSYSFASEVFAIASLTLFMPICLEQFARDNGYLMPDKTESCFVSLDATDGLSMVKAAAPCVVKLGWAWVDTASFSLYVKSIGVALQALVVISMGGIADHPPHRKKILLYCAFSGAAATIAFLFLPSTSPVWLLCIPLAVLANIGFGASMVATNAYLPMLAQESEDVLRCKYELIQYTESHPAASLPRQRNHSLDTDESEDPLLPPVAGNEQVDEHLVSLSTAYNATLSRATSKISSLGIALGYLSGITLLFIALVPVTKLGGSTFSLRLAIGMSGVWWALFTLPAAMWLPSIASTPKAPTAAGEWDDSGSPEEAEKWSAGREIINAWKRLGAMLRWREIKKLRGTFQYLAAWFLLSDGFTTIISTAVLFGKVTLHMSPSSLTLIAILAPTSGILGSLVMPALQKRFAWTNVRVLVTLILLASLIPVYGCMGFLPIFRNSKFGGLTTPSEMYALAFAFGFTYGAFSGYSRAFYAELIPPGEESRWFSLFAITDKTSSFIGPTVVGILADVTGNIRYGFFFTAFMILASVPLLLVINVDKGRREARDSSNQRWTAKQVGKYWTFQNGATAVFLGVDNSNAYVVGTKDAVKWVVREDTTDPEFSSRIICPGTNLHLDVSQKDDAVPGTKVVLGERVAESQQRWRLQRIL